ncbi:hypothetical protein AJ79_02164 [Helicocarpus griseus UAMH5409]|uniref:Aminoglycoside phosphotransferase domain-containing protein n=1 Tax=Helicocarpus griseus UAMH5409 TaxID=1447875 RepID=A0A2B7XVJ4_9EURO|nr:hypothetical protein AJ79_02164 [Helicocarpus griseus UAMH5409]
METNTLIDIVHEMQGQIWVDKVNETHRAGRLCQWVSTFHPDKVLCQLDGSFHHGAFNACVKMVFEECTAWMVRFPRVGMVNDGYADEKVAMEVAALNLIRNRTAIPVPKVRAWGAAIGNSLGLGPFIIMDFIAGVSLSKILEDPNAENPSRVMREDMSDYDIDLIYRPMANFMLQLFDLDFDQIGSLPWPEDKAQHPTLSRPLTFKEHAILQTEELTSSNKYAAFKTLKSLIPDFVHAKYDCSKFKLILDLEWSYIGPAQLFGSAPWWLLQDRPVNDAWDCTGDEPPPKITTRYYKCLETFIHILEEEEAKFLGHEEKELSSLIKWSQASGAMWLHILLSSGFNDHRGFPFTQLRRHLGITKWMGLEKNVSNKNELETFAARKASELEEYEEALEKMEEARALVDSGNMTRNSLPTL